MRPNAVASSSERRKKVGGRNDCPWLSGLGGQYSAQVLVLGEKAVEVEEEKLQNAEVRKKKVAIVNVKS